VVTVQALPNYATFIGDGTVGPFMFNFPFFNNSELTARITDLSGNTSDAIIANVTGAGSSTGGTVTMNSVVPAGYKLTITRLLPLEQLTHIVNGGPYFASTIEAALDYLTMLAQQLDSIVRSTMAITVTTSPNNTTFVNADASLGGGGAGIDGGIIGATVQYSGAGQLTVIKTDDTQYLVAVLPAAGKTICGRYEYDISICGEAASFYPDQNGNLNKV
jgi:hypothetical protein